MKGRKEEERDELLLHQKLQEEEAFEKRTTQTGKAMRIPGKFFSCLRSLGSLFVLFMKWRQSLLLLLMLKGVDTQKRELTEASNLSYPATGLNE